MKNNLEVDSKMFTRFRYWLLILIVPLSACSGLVNVNIDELPETERKRVQNLPIIHTVQLSTRRFNIISLLEGYSCNKWFAPAFRKPAIDILKLQALNIGADGISNIQCSDANYEARFWTSCPALVLCTAEAIQFTR